MHDQANTRPHLIGNTWHLANRMPIPALRRLRRIVIPVTSRRPDETTTSLHRTVETGRTRCLYRRAWRDLKARSASGESRSSASSYTVPYGEAMGAHGPRISPGPPNVPEGGGTGSGGHRDGSPRPCIH